MQPTPLCPHCEAAWPEGPSIRDEGGELRVVYCPACAKAITVLPLIQHVFSA
jgi:protein-disulfide isomerase